MWGQHQLCVPCPPPTRGYGHRHDRLGPARVAVVADHTLTANPNVVHVGMAKRNRERTTIGDVMPTGPIASAPAGPIATPADPAKLPTVDIVRPPRDNPAGKPQPRK